MTIDLSWSSPGPESDGCRAGAERSEDKLARWPVRSLTLGIADKSGEPDAMWWNGLGAVLPEGR